MNRLEFIACGKLLFGNSWKSDLAPQLGYSANSNSVGKIARGQRGIGSNVADDLIAVMQKKVDVLLAAINVLREPDKIIVRQLEHSMVSFDIDGIRIENDFGSFGRSSEIGLLLKDADISMPPHLFELQSIIVSVAAKEALKHNDRNILLDVIDQYFNSEFHARWREK